MKIIRSLFLLLFVFGIFLQPVHAEEKLDAAKEHMLRVWRDYLSLQTKRYDSEFWAYAYIEDYCEAPSWDTLVRARQAAAITGYTLLDCFKMTEEDLSVQEYSLLNKAGIEVGWQTNCFESLEKEIESDYTDFALSWHIPWALAHGCVIQEQDKSFCDYISYSKDYDEANRDLLFWDTNSLLIELFDPERAAAVMAEFDADFPGLKSPGEKWETSKAAIWEKAKNYRERTENALTAGNAMLSKLSSLWINMHEEKEEPGYEKLNRYRFFPDAPTMLPEPDWYSPAKTLSFPFISGTTEMPESGSDLSAYTIDTVITLDTVERERLEEYLKSLEPYGAVIEHETENTWLVRFPDYDMEVILKDEQTLFWFYEQDQTFIYDFYAEAAFKAEESN